MFEDLLLNRKTRRIAEALVSRQPQSIILLQPDNATNSLLAQAIALNLVGSSPSSSQFMYSIRPDSGKRSVTIEQIRITQSFLKLKSADAKQHRVIVLYEADYLTNEAQNALLKSLEDTPPHVTFLLVVSQLSRLLTTVVSRCEKVAVLPVTLEDATDFYLKKGFDKVRISKAYNSAGGQIESLHLELMGTTFNDDRTLAMQAAKKLLRDQLFDRLISVDELSKDRDQATHVLNSLLRLSSWGLYNDAQTKRWLHIHRQTVSALRALDINAHTKLTLTWYAVTLDSPPAA